MGVLISILVGTVNAIVAAIVGIFELIFGGIAWLITGILCCGFCELC